MRTWKRYPLAAVLLSILLLPGSALAGPPAQCPENVSPPEAPAWEQEAPRLGVSWPGSLTLQDAPAPAGPAVERGTEDAGLVDAARRALKLVQRAVLEFHASLLELASRYLS